MGAGIQIKNGSGSVLEDGAEAALPDPMLVQLVSERMQVLRNSYLQTAGHKRPGVKPGLPVAWATDRAAQVTERINELLRQQE